MGVKKSGGVKVWHCRSAARSLLVRRKPRLCLAVELVLILSFARTGLQTVLATRFRGPRRFGNGGAQQGSDARASDLTFTAEKERQENSGAACGKLCPAPSGDRRRRLPPGLCGGWRKECGGKEGNWVSVAASAHQVALMLAPAA